MSWQIYDRTDISDSPNGLGFFVKSSPALTPFTKASEVIAGPTVTQVFTLDGDTVTVVSVDDGAGGLTATITVHSTAGMDAVNVSFPWIARAGLTWDANLRTYHTFRLGGVNSWPSGSPGQQNSSAWPSYGTAPLAVFYDVSDNSGVGFLVFDATQISRTSSKARIINVAWVTQTNATLNPYVRLDCYLAAGESHTYVAQLKVYADGLPDAFFDLYRDDYLRPAFDAAGIVPAELAISGVFSMTSWPQSMSNYDLMGNVMYTFGYAGAQGPAIGHLQWPPSGGGYMRDPNDNDSASAQFAEANRFCCPNFGTFIGPQFVGPTTIPPLLGEVAWDSPTEQAAREGMLAVPGRFHYWDSATSARGMEIRADQKLNFLLRGRQLGKFIAVEGTADVDIWTAGVCLAYNSYAGTADQLPDTRLIQSLFANQTIIVMNDSDDDWIALTLAHTEVNVIALVQMNTGDPPGPKSYWGL